MLMCMRMGMRNGIGIGMGVYGYARESVVQGGRDLSSDLIVRQS